MVFIYIPTTKSPSNLTITPPNNLTEISTTTELPSTTPLATLATAAPLKSTTPKPILMTGKFIPEFLTQDFCGYLEDDLYKEVDEFANSGNFSLAYKITSQYIGMPMTQLVVGATGYCKIPPLSQTPNGTGIVPEPSWDDFANETDKPCTALQVIQLYSVNSISKSKRDKGNIIWDISDFWAHLYRLQLPVDERPHYSDFGRTLFYRPLVHPLILGTCSI